MTSDLHIDVLHPNSFMTLVGTPIIVRGGAEGVMCNIGYMLHIYVLSI